MYDIALIGLGPAGAFLARGLDEGMRVVAIDKKSQNGFQKPCGGLLAPDAQRSLARFGLSLPKDILVSPQIFHVRTIDIATGLTRNYPRRYINLDRARLDEWFISLLPPSTEVVRSAVCTEVTRVEGGFAIEILSGGQRRRILAKAVVGADGANSIVRRCLFPGFSLRRYLAIQQWFPDRHESPFYACVFDPSLTDSYAWGLPKDGDFLFGGAFPLQGARERYDALLAKLPRYGFSLREPYRTQACFVLCPAWPGNACLGGEGAYLLGEAAGLISPSSLEGISYAIDSGALLAECLKDPSPGAFARYQRATRHMRQRLFLKQLKRPFMYQPLLRSLVMRSGLLSTDILS